MKFLDFEAHIIVDGEELPEYGVEYHEETKTAVCWVPSQAGKSFSVTGTPLRQSDFSIIAKTYADGIWAAGSIFPKGRLRCAPMKCSGVRTSATTSRALTFASIELTDDDTLLNSANHKDLGEITVVIHRIEILSENVPFKGSVSTLTNNPIHERSKKAMAHRVSLGAEIVEPASTFTSCKYFEMLCKLTFRYRSIDVLRADGIAPAASTPSATDSKRKTPQDDDDGDDVDDEEQDSDEVGREEEQDKAQLKALLEQISTLEAKMAKKGTKARPKKKIKTEHRPTFIPGEVIDLTL